MPRPPPRPCPAPSCRRERALLKKELAAAERERWKSTERAEDLSARLDDALSKLVALERLHGTTERTEVLSAIEDVVVNLIGSEELAIFEPSPAGTGLVLVHSRGVARGRLAAVRAGAGPIPRAAVDGRGFLAGEGGRKGRDLNACVPLTACGRVVAVWRLLPHKAALGRADRELLKLLGPNAGRALYLTTQRARDE
ncbi:MAG TPA: GAF domain-containing protein [Anaeromyxobacter sp.]|nr:GAF domain-containing protein [Anaeromyxobacter sp.]